MKRLRKRATGSTFVRIAPAKWRLGDGVPGCRRRKLLYGPTFQSIVRRIAAGLDVVSHKRASLRRCPGYHRVEVTLRVDADTVDLFHNSAAGYRAQYYSNVSTGEAANDYAVAWLTPHIVKFLHAAGKRSCPAWWAKNSLLQREAKIWIHQGSWLRLAKHSDRNLEVRRWQDPKRPRRQAWAMLTPAHETRIDLKGAPLTLDGKPYSKNLKPNRGQDIHRRGYT